MKKISILAILVCVLLFVGCDNNSDTIIQTSNQEISGDFTSGDEDFQEDTSLYTHIISGKKVDGSNCIMKKITGKNDVYEEKHYINSDGKEFEITCQLVEIKESQNVFDVRINGEVINMGETSEGVAIPFGIDTVYYEVMWEIDLDENDQYKELVLKRIYGIDSHMMIYRLTSEGLEVIFDEWIDTFDEFVEVN